jgi:hypothetical protein
VGAAQNLFSNLLNSLEQVIGVQPAASIATSAASLVSSIAGSAGSNAAAGPTAAAGAKLNVMA